MVGLTPFVTRGPTNLLYLVNGSLGSKLIAIQRILDIIADSDSTIFSRH